MNKFIDKQPEARQYLIRKGSYFYRPDFQGYTIEKVAAGRYTKTEAEREARIEPHNFTVLHESEVPDAPQVADLKALLSALAAANKRADEAEGLLKQIEDTANEYCGSLGCKDFGTAYAEHSTLKARVAELEGAAEPLASLAHVTPVMAGRGENTRHRTPSDDEQFDWSGRVTWGMLRKLAAALTKKEPTDG